MTNHSIWIAICIGVVLSTGLGAVLVLRKQSHRPLGWALLIAAISLAAAGAILGRFRHEPSSLWLATHIAAGLCLAWMLVCLLLGRHAPQVAGGYHAVEVIEFASLTSGMVAVAILIHSAVIELAFRLFYLAGVDVPRAVFPIEPISFRQAVSPRMAILDIAAVAAAAGIGIRIKRQHSLTTLLFWLATFASLWIGLLVDPVRPAYSPGSPGGTLGGIEWPLPAIVCASAVLLLFVWMQRAGDYFIQRNAWPDAMDQLVAPRPIWPGFRTAAGLVAVAILGIGCLMVTRGWVVPAAAIAAVALFLLADRSWSDNLAETSMALMTLAVVGLSMLGASPPDPSPNGYPILFHRALIALAVMVWLWHWLAAIWSEQLADGRPWTTAGRMVPVARRAGFTIGAIGVLIALMLATWPQRADVTDPDRSLGRWIGGCLGIGLLFLALVWAALRSGKPTVGWLSAFALGAIATFIHFRVKGSGPHLWVVRHLPLLLACAAPIVGALPRTLRLGSANAYREVFLFGGTVVAPAGAIAALYVMEESELAGRWVTTATLSALGLWYAILSAAPRLRDLLWIALALANLAGIDMWNQRGASVMTVSVATTVQVTLSGWLLVCVYWSVLRRPAPRAIAAMTAPVAGVLAAMVVAIARQRL